MSIIDPKSVRRAGLPFNCYFSFTDSTMDLLQLSYTLKNDCNLEPKMVLQSDAIEEPLLVLQRNFETRVP